MANEIYHRSNWGNAVNDIAWGDVYEKFDATNEMFIRSDYYENSNVTDKLMAAINPKPSILLTPTAYDNGSLHSVKPVQSFGSELITNGDFATDSDWIKGTGWSISGGKAVSDGTQTANSGLIQANVFEVGKTYRLEFDLTSNNEVFKFFVNGSQNIFSTNLSDGRHQYYFTTNTSGSAYFQATVDFIGSIDNVSLKEVIDADFDFTRGSSATRVNEQGLIEDVQILSGNLVQNGDFSQIGSELITNGTFDNNINGWSQYVSTSTWDNGTIKTTSTSNLAYIRQNNVFTQNKQYKVTFKAKATNITHNLKIYNGSSFIDTGLSFDVADTYKEFTYYLNFVGSTINLIVGQSNINNGDSINFDNVSVKEVGQNWSFGTGWSMGDGKAVFDGFSNVSLQQDGIVANNKKYRLTYTILDYVQGGVKWRFGLSSNLTPVRNANGTYVEEIIATGSDFRAVTDGATELSIDNVSVIEITEDTDLPRINYTDGEGSLLLEPQSTNIITYSEDFSQWTNTGSETTDTSNALISPSGLLNATKLQEANSNFGYHRLTKSITASSSTDYSLSFFAKKGTISYVQLLLINTSNSDTSSKVFDLENGVIGETILYGSGTLSDAKIEDFGNGWYRCSIVAQLTTTPNTFRINLANASTGNTTNLGMVQYTGNSNGNIYIWGTQMEELSYATSYIPTEGSTVTRLADVCNNAGSSDLINSTEGTLYAEISALANDGTNRAIAISDGTTSNVVRFYYSVTDNRIVGNVKSGGTTVFNYNNVITDATDFLKIAISYKANDFKMYVNGTEVSTDISGNVPTGLTELAFDNGVGNDKFNGNVKTVAVFDYLDNDQLERLTGEGYETFKLLAQANNYTII